MQSLHIVRWEWAWSIRLGSIVCDPGMAALITVNIGPLECDLPGLSARSTA
jgi:hypothetical protein